MQSQGMLNIGIIAENSACLCLAANEQPYLDIATQKLGCQAAADKSRSAQDKHTINGGKLHRAIRFRLHSARALYAAISA